RVQKILVDGGQLAGEHFVQEIDDLGIGFHGELRNLLHSADDWETASMDRANGSRSYVGRWPPRRRRLGRSWAMHTGLDCADWKLLARSPPEILHRGEDLRLDVRVSLFGDGPAIEVDQEKAIEHPALRGIHVRSNHLDVQTEKTSADRQEQSRAIEG